MSVTTRAPFKPAASLSLTEARQIALRAQGFAHARSAAVVDQAALTRIVQTLGVVQMDSVNVLVRSHYLPFFSRLGAYDRSLLSEVGYGPERSLFEYWGHEASLLPLEFQPLFRWRMQRAREGVGTYKRVGRFLREKASFVEDVRQQLRERGPMGAGELEAGKKGKKGWWEWSDAKVAFEALFWIGEVTTVTRRHFERIYDLTERVLPANILERPTPAVDEAQRQLVDRAAQALGVATERDLRDYFRLSPQDAKNAITSLLEAGTLLAVSVESWQQAAYLHTGAPAPTSVEAVALLSPFDSLVWERSRAERLFDFHYRLEIYTPAHKRVHGYYVLPFLFGDRVVARVDLKADRAAGVLRVPSAHIESGSDEAAVAHALRAELLRMAQWLGLERVVLGRRGKFVAALRAASRD